MAFATTSQLLPPQALAVSPEMHSSPRARRVGRITSHLIPRENRERCAAELRRVEQYRTLQALRNARKLLEKARRLIRSRSKALRASNKKQNLPECPSASDLHTITRSLEGLDLEDNQSISQEDLGDPAATTTVPVDDQDIIKITEGIEGLVLDDNQNINQEVPKAPTAIITAPAGDRKFILRVVFGNGRLSSEIRRGGQ
ncbi:hypothetical protein L211DRAFT_661516 [Terfezia boudieri ATCC MYA-4762]|uniref:Uncharacterized protein n=1 Tax=Terfezia boudieri ATCC MYA-4762 TaxID=1051890 RepID=A0A3N4M0K6_9PEZI|nr:hypothetical protein L211DRAFT_661516 [Terfezia boudieri ATCC MYA-4762]